MLYDHHAISFADRTGQSCQRLLGGRAETAQSLCNLHNLHIITGCCSCDVLADSLQESTIIWRPNDYLKSSGVVRSASGTRTDIMRSTCLWATILRFFQICHSAEFNKIVVATMPVHPQGKGDLDIVRASLAHRKANVT